MEDTKLTIEIRELSNGNLFDLLNLRNELKPDVSKLIADTLNKHQGKAGSSDTRIKDTDIGLEVVVRWGSYK